MKEFILEIGGIFIFALLFFAVAIPLVGLLVKFGIVVFKALGIIA